MAFNGTWNIAMKTPMGERKAGITLKQDGETLTGKMDSDGQTGEITNGKVENGRAKWQVSVTTPMPLTLSFDVAENDGKLDGTVELGMFGSSEVSGTPA